MKYIEQLLLNFQISLNLISKCIKNLVHCFAKIIEKSHVLKKNLYLVLENQSALNKPTF